MTWPTTAIPTTNLDAGTDSPATARANLLQLAQQVNQLQAHVSAFAATLLDDADTATARTTLGAGTVGNLLFIAPTQDYARNTLGLEVPVGQGQTFQNLTGSRALSTTYTSPASRAIFVMVTAQAGSAQRFYIAIGGAGDSFGTVGASSYGSIQFLVPANTTYRVELTGGTLQNWFEVRS